MVSGKIGVIAAVRKTGCYLDGVLNYGYVEKKAAGRCGNLRLPRPGVGRFLVLRKGSLARRQDR
jgi:hypothetical protein